MINGIFYEVDIRMAREIRLENPITLSGYESCYIWNKLKRATIPMIHLILFSTITQAKSSHYTKRWSMNIL